MDRTRRQIFRQILTLAALVGSAPLRVVRAASTPDPSGIVDLGTYRRGRTGPLPAIVRSPADLVAARLVLPFDRANVRRSDTYSRYVYKPGAYESVGMQPSMGGTGERQEIGLLTDAQADWLMGGPADNMLAQAEAHGSVPVHYLADGQVVDLFKYPKASSDYRAKEPRYSDWKPYFDIDAAPVKPDTAHYPSLSYVPYLATLDRYHLAELQFAAVYAVMSPTPPVVPGVMAELQTRQWAWGLRCLFQAYSATPDGEVETPLMPKSYFKKLLDAHLAFLKQKITRADALMRNTGFLMTLGNCVPWQEDYISMVLGWAIYTGRFPEWREIYDFQIRQAVIRATGPLRSQAVHYGLELRGATDWPSLLAANGHKTTPDGHLDAAQVRGIPHLPGFLRGALKVAVMNGVPGAEAAFAYADAETKHYGYLPMRWAV